MILDSIQSNSVAKRKMKPRDVKRISSEARVRSQWVGVNKFSINSERKGSKNWGEKRKNFSLRTGWTFQEESDHISNIKLPTV